MKRPPVGASRWLTILCGLGLLVLAGQLPRGEASGEPVHAHGTSRSAAEPLAAALAPLGPVRALVSAALWVRYLQSRVTGDDEQLALLSEGLLAVHPELERVRAHLASQLIVGSAPRAPDPARHRALIQRGLGMLEDGLALEDSALLHGALGRLLALQPRSDPFFASAARQYFGLPPTDLAIDELRSAGSLDSSPVFLADLLVERGLAAWRQARDRPAAERDLAEAEQVTARLPGSDASDLARRIADLRANLGAADAPAPPSDPGRQPDSRPGSDRGDTPDGRPAADPGRSPSDRLGPGPSHEQHP